MIASGALATIRAYDKNSAEEDAKVGLEANLVLIDANYTDDSRQVKVRAEVESSIAMTKLLYLTTTRFL